MSFQNKNLSVIAYANGFTLWHYSATETLATIAANGYFNNVKTLMNIGGTNTGKRESGWKRKTPLNARRLPMQ